MRAIVSQFVIRMNARHVTLSSMDTEGKSAVTCLETDHRDQLSARCGTQSIVILLSSCSKTQRLTADFQRPFLQFPEVDQPTSTRSNVREMLIPMTLLIICGPSVTSLD